MCMAPHTLDQVSREVVQRIQSSPHYKLVAVIDEAGTKKVWSEDQDVLDLINPIQLTCLVLENKEGDLFDIEPTVIGVRFAQGSCSYSEYKRLQQQEKKESRQFMLLAASSFLLVGVILAGVMV